MTHDAGGISELDFQLAKEANALAGVKHRFKSYFPSICTTAAAATSVSHKDLIGGGFC